jgi:cytolysin-activating lysine-acyltransferase
LPDKAENVIRRADLAKRIDAGDNRLTAVEWKSGTHMRMVDIVAPFGGEAEMRGQVL